MLFPRDFLTAQFWDFPSQLLGLFCVGFKPSESCCQFSHQFNGLACSAAGQLTSTAQGRQFHLACKCLLFLLCLASLPSVSSKQRCRGLPGKVVTMQPCWSCIHARRPLSQGNRGVCSLSRLPESPSLPCKKSRFYTVKKSPGNVCFYAR